MIDKKEVQALVRIVSSARGAKKADSVILSELVAIGIPAEHAPKLLEEVTHGLKFGVGAAVTGEDVTMKLAGQTDLYLAAFKEGQLQFRRAMGNGLFARPLLWAGGAVIIAGIIAFLFWMR